MHTESDEPSMIRLWSEHGGWDEIDSQIWAHRFVNTPLGAAPTVLATDAVSGELVGQFPFVPSLVMVNGQPVRALRPFAPIVAKSARGSFLSANPFDHPIVAMYMHATKALRSRGEGLVYMVPDPHWLPFFRVFPMLQCGSFPLWSRSLPLSVRLPLGEAYRAAPLQTWDERVDRLWRATLRLHGCLVVRDTRMLPWKVSHGEYNITVVERQEELVGLVVSRRKGERQWLVCDVLAADSGESLRATLIAVTNVAHAMAVVAPAEDPIHKVAVLTTPVLEPVLRELGFARDAYDFPLVVHVLDPAIASHDVAPARWYVSAND
jgi:hypothetical protein